ncbi:unnamed protein product [Orchesella dallaii]|uniref:Gustatory receptor n=1 Tax=Orchesella dallaii TaxID=48710 RepID=A0ABP1RVJ9_9HEXA
MGLHRCHYLIVQYKTAGKINSQEFFIYVLNITMTTQALVTLHTIDRDPSEFSSMVTQMLNAGRIKHVGWPNSKRLPDLQEISAYVMAAGFFAFPLLTAVYPLIASNDPIDILLQNHVPVLPRSILACFVYGIFVSGCANICSIFILEFVTHVQTLQGETEENLRLSLGLHERPRANRLEVIAQTVLKAVFIFLERTIYGSNSKVQPHTSFRNQTEEIGANSLRIQQNFGRRRFDHIKITLLINFVNAVTDVFVPTMTAVGILMCTIINYGLITMRDNTEIRTLMYVSLIPLVCINAIILFLCHHGSLPLINTSNLISYWKGKLRGKLDKILLRGMRPAGFRLGRFFFTKRETALDINDIILNATISLLLT